MAARQAGRLAWIVLPWQVRRMEQAKNIFFYPEVDTEDVAELKYLKEGELKRKRVSRKLTRVPFKEEN